MVGSTTITPMQRDKRFKGDPPTDDRSVSQP
jgi:hypothetical protein